MRKKTAPATVVRIEHIIGDDIKIQDPKRHESHTIYRFKMFFHTHEQCTWNELVVEKGTKLYKRLSRKKHLPRMVFLAKQHGKTFPIRIGRSAPLRRSHLLSYNMWTTSWVVSVTFEKISALDMVELLDKN